MADHGGNGGLLDLAVYKAHIESLDRAAWMAGVQADVDKAAKAAGTQSAQ